MVPCENVLDSQSTVSQQRAAEIITRVAEAVHYAHKQGFVHRDIKPANLLIDKEGRPHIADFGLALHESVQRKRAGERAGTPVYMAPEQIRGEAHRLDGRADIWALGVVLYEMLSGRRPFAGDSFAEISDEILHREPKPPRQIDEAISTELERICLRCLEKPVIHRYQSAAELAEALAKFSVPAQGQAAIVPEVPWRTAGDEAEFIAGQASQEGGAAVPKASALVDGRLLTELLHVFRAAPLEFRGDLRCPSQMLHAIGRYDQILLEEGACDPTVLAELMAAEWNLLGEVLFVVKSPRVRREEECNLVLADAATARRQDRGSPWAAGALGLDGPGGAAAIDVELSELQRLLQLAAAFNAAIVPHPDCWPLYRAMFADCAWAEDGAPLALGVEPLPSPDGAALAAIPAARAERVERWLPRFPRGHVPAGMLARYGPAPFPFPKALLRSYDREYLASFGAFQYEFCTLQESDPSA